MMGPRPLDWWKAVAGKEVVIGRNRTYCIEVDFFVYLKL